MQITIPDTVTFKIARLDKGIECDLSKAVDPADAARVIFEYGLRRFLNDATGGEGLSDADRLKKAVSKMKALLSGEIRHRAGGPRLEPWVRHYRSLVVAFLRGRGIISKAADADKIAALERTALVAEVCKIKPEFSPGKVTALFESFEVRARDMANLAGDDIDLA